MNFTTSLKEAKKKVRAELRKDKKCKHIWIYKLVDYDGEIYYCSKCLKEIQVDLNDNKITIVRRSLL